jgi:hypothetical protein
MNDLTPNFVRETGQVIIEGLPTGAAGEASLVPVPGLNLAFDRADGRLSRVIVDLAGMDCCTAAGEQVVTMLIRLFGTEAPGVIAGVADQPGEATAAAYVLSPETDLTAALSRLARLNAARDTSPMPPSSPAWAAEAAELAERAGLPVRARTEASAAVPLPPALDVAAELESLEEDRVRLAGLNWMLDPDLIPQGTFRPGLSPQSDLFVRHEGTQGRVIVKAQLALTADCATLRHCRARLVDPAIRRVLAQAGFTKVGSKVHAELRLPFPLDEVPESWIEVVQDEHRPVRSTRGHQIRRALRWADAALRAERAPTALAPHSTAADWAALAVAAWERCRRDWKAAGDADRAYLAARRLAALDRKPGTCLPPSPSVTAADTARQVPVDGPAYLAEALGH